MLNSAGSPMFKFYVTLQIRLSEASLERMRTRCRSWSNLPVLIVLSLLFELLCAKTTFMTCRATAVASHRLTFPCHISKDNFLSSFFLCESRGKLLLNDVFSYEVKTSYSQGHYHLLHVEDVLSCAPCGSNF